MKPPHSWQVVGVDSSTANATAITICFKVSVIALLLRSQGQVGPGREGKGRQIAADRRRYLLLVLLANLVIAFWKVHGDSISGRRLRDLSSANFAGYCAYHFSTPFGLSF
jgi:hypothetical protein